ncbi:hypothetical protein RIF29_13984 [Crotalaria pallida]|uniref:Uncharacterized protein n=1 Tax=Crotalaria pallida TaxID=3830 RepID=A0AAN9FAX9_CROPI
MESDLDLDFALQEALAASPSSSTLPNLQQQKPLPDDAVLNPTYSPTALSKKSRTPLVGKFCAQPKGDSDIDEDEPQTQIVDDVDLMVTLLRIS